MYGYVIPTARDNLAFEFTTGKIKRISQSEARLQMGDASYRFEKAMIELEDHDKRGRIFSNFEYDEEGAIPNHFWFTGN